MSAPRERKGTQWRPISFAICVLMLLATAAFAIASIVHFGAVIALGPIKLDDPFPGAAIPEGVIAIVLAAGSVSVIARLPARWLVALATTLFALLLTVYGLTITLRSSRTGDVVYHVSILVVSAVIVGLLLLPPGKRSMSV